MFITGPDVVKTVTGEDVTLRGARRRQDATPPSRASRTSCADDEEPASTRCATCCRSCPSNNLEDPPHVEPTDDPDRARATALLDLMPAERPTSPTT